MSPTLSEIREEIASYGHREPEYYQRMMHQVPDAPVVDRTKFILERCRDKRVLNLGCASGGLHEAIRQVASGLTGVDHHRPYDVWMDLNEIDGNHVEDQWEREFGQKPVHSGFGLIVCGEVLEHLDCPGPLLWFLKKFKAPLLLTAPNAFSEIAAAHMAGGVENVNVDHVAWYSYRTLRTLLERYDWQAREFCWYNGRPRTAEGLIFLAD